MIVQPSSATQMLSSVLRMGARTMWLPAAGPDRALLRKASSGSFSATAFSCPKHPFKRCRIALQVHRQEVLGQATV